MLLTRLPFGGSVGCTWFNLLHVQEKLPLAAAHRLRHAEELVHQLQLPSSHFSHHFVIDLRRDDMCCCVGLCEDLETS